MKGRNPRRGERRYIFRSAWKRGLAALLDGCGFVLVRLATLGRGLRRPDTAVLRAPRSILVVRLDHLGDVLFSRPCMQALKTRFPEARICALVSSIGSTLLQADPWVDEVITWDAPWFARNPVPKTQAGFLRLARALRRKRFDVSLDLRGDFRHHVLLWLAGVRVRIGYGITGGAFLLHRPLRLRVGVHEVIRNLEAAGAAGAGDWPRRFPPLVLTAEEKKQGEAFWPGNRRRVVMHPSAGEPARRWPPEKFARICDALHEDGCEVILIGTAGERPIAEAILANCRHAPRALCGQTTLRELIALIGSAELLIGNESGPAHLAVTQGLPAVILWGQTTDPAEWGPWGEACRVEVICGSQREEAVADVAAAARRLLAGKDAKKRPGPALQ